MRRRDQYWTYIATNRTRTLYTGVTNDIARRMYEHKQGIFPGFTSKYRIDRLVYFESYSNILDAIAREKKIKGWRRERKVALIEAFNPTWKDFTEEWSMTGEGPSLRSG